MDFDNKLILKIDQKPFQQRYAMSVGSTSRPQNFENLSKLKCFLELYFSKILLDFLNILEGKRSQVGVKMELKETYAKKSVKAESAYFF